MASPDFDDGGESDTWIHNLTAEWDLGWAALTVSSSFYEHNITYAEEQRVGGRFGTIRITDRGNSGTPCRGSQHLTITGTALREIAILTTVGTTGSMPYARTSVVDPADSGPEAASGSTRT